MAEEIAERPGTELARADGLRGPDRRGRRPDPRQPLRSAAIRAMQSQSERDIQSRLPGIVAAVREVADRDGGARLRQRRRHRQPRPHGRRGDRHRAHRRARASTPRRCSTTTARSSSSRRRSSACPSSAGPSAASRRCSAAATSPPGRRPPTGSPSPTSRAGCASTARRAPARSRARSSAPPPTSSGSATASTCATRRPASCASASTGSTWSRDEGIVDEVPTYRGEGQRLPLDE